MPIDLNDSGLEAAFTLESQKTGVIDEVPFRILVLGDFAGKGERRGLDSRRPIEIDRDNFDEVMARISPRLELDLGGSSISLEFAELDDLHPDGIFRQVSLFEDLRSLRKRLKDSNTFNSTAREARRLFGIEAPAADVTTEERGEDSGDEGGGLLDSILARPEGGGAAPRRGASGDLGRLVSDLVRPHLVSFDEGEQANLIAAADAAISGLMREIIGHHDFKELEAAWRGLYLMTRRIPTSTQLKIYVVDISKAELASDLKNCESLSDSVLYKWAIRDAVETPGGEPWAVICGAYAFSADVEDIAALMRISKVAAGARAPFVSHLRPDVLGIHSFAADPDAASWRIDADSNAAKLWAALRSQAESRSLGMVTPRFLARLPYGRDTDPVETFDFEEFSEGPVHDSYLWANGAFLAATLLGLTFAEHEWEMGDRLMQDIDGLPVHVYKEAGETIFKPCSEILMTDGGVNKLLDAGFMPLISYRSTDHVKVGRFQSIADPTTGLKGRWSRD